MTKNEAMQAGNHFPGNIVSAERETNTFLFRCRNGTGLNLTVMRDDVLRFRYSPEPELDFADDFSYALADDFETGFKQLDFFEQPDCYQLVTASLNCRIDKKNMKIRICDNDGRVLVEDELGFHWQTNPDYGGTVPKMSKHRHKDERFYGLGDKPTDLNLSQKRLHNWNSDEYAFLPNHDPLYKSIPFYVSLCESIAYGIFFDNSFATYFDFGCERSDVTSFWASGGEMNFYFIYGAQVETVARTYTHLTGTPSLPPLWALGYHQSKWSYYPEREIKELAEKFRSLKIPCDVLHIDIDYMDGFRCFTWDKKGFPDPKRMIADLKSQGFNTVVIIDPGIKVDKDYEIHQQGIAGNHFCRRSDGPFMRGKVWPGDCYFPDFTNPETRLWWADLFKGLADDGVAGVWNDMNEPAVMEVPSKTFPLDVRHDYDGRNCSHRKAHNVYGMQMARATFEGLSKHCFPRRPFVITRAAYAGAQRYCASWTGDNIANWDHLNTANIQLQRMNLSGMGFCSSDIGGFEEQPSAELYTRWIQLGVFHPFCRTHSSGHHGDQEPWAFGDQVSDIARRYIGLRYELLQYLYTTFYEYCRFGIPMLRSMLMEDQSDVRVIESETDFMFGRHIMVCPIIESGAKHREVYLPEGQWYGFHDQAKYSGKMTYNLPVDLNDIPVFVRAGAAIPRLPVQQYVGELDIDTVPLDVYCSEKEVVSRMYQDACDGYDYKISGYCLHTFVHRITKNAENKDCLILTHTREGSYTGGYRNLRFQFIGLTFQIRNVTVNGKELTYPQDALNDNHITVSVDCKELVLST